MDKFILTRETTMTRLLLISFIILLGSCSFATNLNTIIIKAIKANKTEINIPGGNYTISKETIKLPDNTQLTGIGNVNIKLTNDIKQAFILGNNCQINNINIDGKNGIAGGINEGIIFIPKNINDSKLLNINFKNTNIPCIVTDNSNNTLIEKCNFSNIYMAISIQFSSNVRIKDNTITNAEFHGIQFWGNWKWEKKVSENIIITGNIVKDGGEGAIWGTGAKNVIISNNIVNGANDVGIDLEWCDESIISSNTVSNAENGCISLFFSCKQISITGNTILNNREYSKPNIDGWYARAGIWLTYPNTKDFPNDTGHENITITGNIIKNITGTKRRGIWIGSNDCKNIALSNNIIIDENLYISDKIEPYSTNINLLIN